MKKLLLLLMFTLLLTACGSEPEVLEIPDDATVAICTQGQVFKYIYEGDTVYEFYTDDVLQSDDMLNIVQNAVDGAGTARDYIDGAFEDGSCTFTDYDPS